MGPAPEQTHMGLVKNCLPFRAYLLWYEQKFAILTGGWPAKAGTIFQEKIDCVSFGQNLFLRFWVTTDKGQRKKDFNMLPENIVLASWKFMYVHIGS